MRKPEKQTPEPVSSRLLFSFSNHIEQVKITLTDCKLSIQNSNELSLTCISLI
ncbi:unnamed protein product [Schistosoma curassoni]|uniref:Uncharacterized protein n=1 Tax=Schistosoma curassoni TaxID=6186 RepID=A0A183JRV6_9TREM|nr:unnamed protein product [Schistosoma curassoni]